MSQIHSYIQHWCDQINMKVLSHSSLDHNEPSQPFILSALPGDVT